MTVAVVYSMTVIVPCIEGCGEHPKAKVPTASKVAEWVSPSCNPEEESDSDPLNVTV